MKPSTVDLLINPHTHESLELVREPDGCEALVSEISGQKFPICDGIAVFMAKTTGLNKRAQTLYNLFAPLYDFFVRIFGRFTVREETWRKEFLRELEIKEGARVLEVSIGTGANIRYLPRQIACFGLDISWGMLKKCQKNLKSWDLEAELFLGEAENLPFKDEVFDVVFHIGGINFFNDKSRAINEMIRVAKPGTKIIIGDETRKAFTFPEKIPVLKRFIRSAAEKASPPIDLLPPGMLDPKVDYLINGILYRLSFRKP